MTRNDFKENISQALDEMKKEQGSSFDLSKVNLAELERRTGISRSKLRRLNRNLACPLSEFAKLIVRYPFSMILPGAVIRNSVKVEPGAWIRANEVVE